VTKTNNFEFISICSSLISFTQVVRMLHDGFCCSLMQDKSKNQSVRQASVDSKG